MKLAFKTIVFLFTSLSVVGITLAQMPTSTPNAQGPAFPVVDPNRPVGVSKTSETVSDGYILLSIVQDKEILLMSNDGRIVNKWGSEYYAGQSAYLLPNGNLLRTASLPTNAFGSDGQFGYVAGRLEEYDWSGNLVWSYELATETLVGHHDIQPMPNGHILMLYYEKFTGEQALSAGRDPALIPAENQLWSEAIFELDPTTNQIIWEWHAWDHLIQDFDPKQNNYGVVADHPEKINLNYLDPEARPNTDWLHANAIDYNPDLDQIILSSRSYSEFWIINHHTTTEEAKGNAGDLLYRYGNPATYNTGTPEGRPLYFQHNPYWIPKGYPGAGNILVFDNGSNLRPYSRVLELSLPRDSSGTYSMKPGQPTTADIVWQYEAAPPESFYTSLISGAQRQYNGNTLIANGLNGTVFEVDSTGDIVWEDLLPPGTWVFRAERYDLSGLNIDLSKDLGFENGLVWNATCNNGTEKYLLQYDITQYPTMMNYMDQYGEDAGAHWAIETCANDGGLAR